MTNAVLLNKVSDLASVKEKRLYTVFIDNQDGETGRWIQSASILVDHEAKTFNVLLSETIGDVVSLPSFNAIFDLIGLVPSHYDLNILEDGVPVLGGLPLFIVVDDENETLTITNSDTQVN